MRRSGPCDLANERTCSTRPGSQAASETSGAELIAPEWSSSITTVSAAARVRRSSAASSAPRSVVSDAPVGFCARVCSSTTLGAAASPAANASGRIPSASTATGTGCSPYWSSRSRNGGKVGSPTSTRSPNRTSRPSARSIASSAPLVTVIDSTGVGQVSRSRSCSSGMSGLAW